MSAVGSLDRKSLEKFLAGSEAGFEELVVRYESSVFALCLFMTRSQDEAEELLSAVFCDAYRQWPVQEGEFSVALWLYRRVIEGASQPRFHSQSESIETLVLEVEGDLPLRSASGELMLAVRRLPYEYRAVLVLCDVLTLPIIQAAAALSISELEARAYLHRARLMAVRRLTRHGSELGSDGLVGAGSESPIDQVTTQ